MPDPDIPEFYSTVPVSSPTVVPEAEDIPMNGFVWSVQFGLMLAYRQDGSQALDELARLREPLEDINVDDQGMRGLDG